MGRLPRSPRPPRGLQGALGASLALGLGLTQASCGLSEPRDPWRDQLEPSGPCWRVDLADGLDEESTAEVHDLFDCLDQGGSLAPLAGLDRALDEPDRSGGAAGLGLARLVNGLPELGIEPFGLLGAAGELLERRAELLQPLLELFVELTYGETYESVLLQDTPAEAEALARGVLAPALPVLGVAAGALLDDELAAAERLARLLEGPLSGDALCTLLALITEDDAELVALRARLPRDLGQAIDRARSPGNDLWSGASGDSLRDLVFALLVPDDAGSTGVERLAPALEPILGDEELRRRLLDVLAAAEDGGHLDPLPGQLAHLAAIDVRGGERTADEDSALTALLRLLHRGNDEVVCTIDLGITELDIDLGNLSVAILKLLSKLDPDAVEGGVDLLGGVLGWGFTQDTLDWVADTGVCPVLDEQLVDDLQSIDRLGDPEVGDLLVVLLDLLGAFGDEDEADDRTEELVVLLSAAFEAELLPPVEELLADLGGSALVDDLTDLLPLLLEADGWEDGACPAGTAPLALEDTLELAAEAMADGDPALTSLEPLSTPMLEEAATWETVGNLARLLQEDGTRLEGLGELVVELVALDPELEALDSLAGLLREEELLRGGLQLLETPALLEAAGASSAEDPGPLPFGARLVTSGTVEVLLRTVDLVLGELGGRVEAATKDARGR